MRSDFMYEMGVFVALLIWFWKIIYAFLQLNSTKAKNLRLIGRRLSWLDFSVKEITLKYEQENIIYRLMKFGLIWVVLPFIFAFTSWFFVVFQIGIFLYRRTQNNGIPQKIKEYQWKINNLNLNFDQMVELVFENTDQNQFTLEQFKHHLEDTAKRYIP